MSADNELQQKAEWQALHDRIAAMLDPFGRRDAFGEGDYWLVDENLGPWRQRLEVRNLKLLQPTLIKALQELLSSYPRWEIVVEVCGLDEEWPGMGLIIRQDEIIDELQRRYFPEEFRHFFYQGSKRRFD